MSGMSGMSVSLASRRVCCSTTYLRLPLPITDHHLPIRIVARLLQRRPEEGVELRGKAIEGWRERKRRLEEKEKKAH